MSPWPERVLAALHRVNRWLATLLGVALLACAALVLLDIVLRQFHASFGGTDEISGYVMAIVTSWGMAYALLELGHVRIDALRSRLPGFGRAALDLLAMSALAGTATLIAYRSWPVVARSLANASRANTPLETPLAWVQLPWFAGWAWFALSAWLMLLAAGVLLLRGQAATAERAIGLFAEHEVQPGSADTAKATPSPRHSTEGSAE